MEWIKVTSVTTTGSAGSATGTSGSSAGVASSTDLVYPVVGGVYQVDVAGGGAVANEVAVFMLVV